LSISTRLPVAGTPIKGFNRMSSRRISRREGRTWERLVGCIGALQLAGTKSG
jgi:hypothetical protein